MPTVGERLDASLREITTPLMDQFHEIRLEIEVREAELAELRAARLRLTTIIRQIDPELAPKKEQKKAAVSVSEETVTGILDWLKLHMNGDEFYASGLKKLPHFPPVAQSQVSKSLAVLHDRGQIRLVRSGSGGSKYFKVVA